MEKKDSGIHVSRRAREMHPFLVMEVLERAAELERAGKSVIHLEVGEPDFETPEVIREAGIRAIREGKTHYTHSLGKPELREALVDWHTRQYGVSASPDNIVVTLGSSSAMVLVFGALLNPGDEVLLSNPCYSCYAKFIRAFGGVPVKISVSEEDGFQFPVHEVERSLGVRTRALVLNSPSNPTGTLTQPDRLAQLSALIKGHAVLISDEIYHGLVYEGRACSAREFDPNAVVINGFSKLFAMTGWRLGYAIVPPELIRPVQKMQQNLFISATDFAQAAAIAALREAAPDVARMRREYDRRRRFVLRRLREIGLRVVVEPTGAFYVFINVKAYTDNVYDFSFRILDEVGVAVTPGVDFGSNGEGFVRICYANSMERLEEGMERLEKFFA